MVTKSMSAPLRGVVALGHVAADHVAGVVGHAPHDHDPEQDDDPEPDLRPLAHGPPRPAHPAICAISIALPSGSSRYIALIPSGATSVMSSAGVMPLAASAARVATMSLVSSVTWVIPR